PLARAVGLALAQRLKRSRRVQPDAIASSSRTAANGLTQRFGDEADSEHGLPGFVQKLHPPFCVLLQAARNAAEQVTATPGHLGPCGFVALEFRAVIRRAGIAAVADPEKIQRHDWAHALVGPRPAT